MFTFLFLTGLAASTQVDGLKKIDLPLRRTLTGSTGEVNGPALLWSLQKTLNKYHSKRAIEASVNASLVQRLATENLIDQVEAPDFDEEYYGPMEVGSNEQVFTVQFDTGSSDIFIPGPQCTNEQGCPLNRKYDQAGVFQDRTTVVQYGSGYIEGDDYTDSISVAGLTATDQGLISLTQASGFNTSASDGLLGMGFTSIAASGFTTFFENLMIQQKVGASILFKPDPLWLLPIQSTLTNPSCTRILLLPRSCCIRHRQPGLPLPRMPRPFQIHRHLYPSPSDGSRLLADPPQHRNRQQHPRRAPHGRSSHHRHGHDPRPRPHSRRVRHLRADPQRISHPLGRLQRPDILRVPLRDALELHPCHSVWGKVFWDQSARFQRRALDVWVCEVTG